MDFTARRFAALLAAITWAIVSLVIPVSAHAATYNAASNLSGRQWYVPAQGTGIAGAAVVATAASMLAKANPWVAALTLGTPVMQYLLEKNGGDRLAIRAKDAPVATPPGWTTNPDGIPSPPATAPLAGGSSYSATATPRATQWMYQQTDVSGNYRAYSTIASACAAMDARGNNYYGFYPHPNGSDTCLASKNAPFQGWGEGVSGGNTCSADGQIWGQGCTDYSCPSGGTLSGTGAASVCNVAPTCPTGYAVSQGYCTIIDPWSVKFPADGIPTYRPMSDGTGFEPDPRDPDPVPSSPTPSEIQNPSGQYHQDPFGNPTSTQITPQSGGGYKIDQRVQTTTNNQTTTTINNITVNNAGNVVSISSTTVPGSIEQASPTSTPAAKIDFPTDYNREATQLAVKSKLDEIQAGAGAGEAPNYQVDQKKIDMNQAIKEKIDDIPGQYSGDKSSWFSWVWTPPVGACQPWVSTIHGQSVTWNICPYVDKIRDVIGYLLAVMSAAAVYSQLFRRDES